MRQLTVVEVSPRDGLQNESAVLATEAKVELIARLVSAGARRVEAVSFAHPRLVPAMADAEAVMGQVPRGEDVSYAGLVLNRRGLDRAVDAGVDEVDVVVCVSDTFSRRNQNLGSHEAMAMAEQVAADAGAHGLFTTLTLATAFGCPFEGRVDPQVVSSLVDHFRGLGAEEIVLADTIGVATPRQVKSLIEQTKADGFHGHNTRNTGFANAYAALEAGATTLDASIGGLGGCPFAPRATGNIATEDLVYMLEGDGVETGVDLEALISISEWLESLLGRRLEGQLYRAGRFPA